MIDTICSPVNKVIYFEEIYLTNWNVYGISKQNFTLTNRARHLKSKLYDFQSYALEFK